jgi:hypothetical protein
MAVSVSTITGASFKKNKCLKNRKKAEKERAMTTRAAAAEKAKMKKAKPVVAEAVAAKVTTPIQNKFVAEVEMPFMGEMAIEQVLNTTFSLNYATIDGIIRVANEIAPEQDVPHWGKAFPMPEPILPAVRIAAAVENEIKSTGETTSVPI